MRQCGLRAGVQKTCPVGIQIPDKLKFRKQTWMKITKLKSKNYAKNDQEECLIKTQTDNRQKTFCFRHKLSVTNTGGLSQKQTVLERHILSVADKLCLWRTFFLLRERKKICDRRKLSVTEINCLWHKKTVSAGHILFVTNTDYLWQTQTICDRHSFSVTDTYCLWKIYIFLTYKDFLRQTTTVCDKKRLSVTDTTFLWPTQTDFDRHRLSVTDTDCLWQTQTVYGRNL